MFFFSLAKDEHGRKKVNNKLQEGEAEMRSRRKENLVIAPLIAGFDFQKQLAMCHWGVCAPVQ